MTSDRSLCLQIVVMVGIIVIIAFVSYSVFSYTVNIPSQENCDKLYDKYEGTLSPTGYSLVNQNGANDFCEYNDTYGGLWFNKTRFVETFQRAI